MTFDNFVKKYFGSAINYDGACGVQCVDLARIFSKEVVGEDMGHTPTGYACGYFTNPTAQVKKLFTLIKNTPSFVPKKGDLMVWSSALNGKAGHIAVCTGEGNTSYFYSYDYNWRGQNDGWTKVKHNYHCVLGVLRPKNQKNITGTAKILDKTGFQKGNKTDGAFALKCLLILDGAKLDDNSVVGDGTLNAVNTRLKAWGYSQNGIAGDNFIRKLRQKISNK